MKNRTMKVLAISDQVFEPLYGPALRKVAGDVEFVLSCGDLPSAYLEYIVSVLDVPLLYVMGNHGGSGGARELPEGCTNLDGQTIEYHGILLAGLAGSMRYNGQTRYQHTEAEMRAKVAKLSPALLANRLRYGRYVDICISHAPPFGIHDGRDLAHRGFKSFNWMIDRYRPRYWIHGHQHIYDNRTVRETVRGDTLVINAFGYKILDLHGSILSTNRTRF